jgi:hypothetical protein
MVFSQWVMLDGSDNAWSILPMGASEIQGAHNTAQVSLWKRGSLKPSPRTREGLERFGWNDAMSLPTHGW